MLRLRQVFDKYRIEKRLAEGGFAHVYQARDTIEGIRVALKIPNLNIVGREGMEAFRREVRLVARLDHPNILSVKNASFIDGHFVISYPLGSRNLEERLDKRLSLKKALSYAEQILEALAHAHSHRIIHCDVKPENIILFPGDHIRLGDFGLARAARRTLSGSGSGTVGYFAPEQAFGKPSAAGDVFSAGLVIYRMLTGALPEWPYDWPPPRYDLLRRKVHPSLIKLLRRSLQVDRKRRFPDALRMLAAFRRLPKGGRREASGRRSAGGARSWREHRISQFKRTFGRLLQAHHHCSRCEGPISEWMKTCPWCGHAPSIYRGPTLFAARCRRCGRGMKSEWKYCVACYGGAQGPRASRLYPDRRYRFSCSACRKPLMAFMAYCPWCRRKATPGWQIAGSKATCTACGWGVLRDYWRYCPWCGRPVGGST